MSDAVFAPNQKYINNVVSRLKKGISKETAKGRYNQALSLLSACAAVLYKANQCYSDAMLENTLVSICQAVLPEETPERHWDKNTILFYDGFGLNDRGLIRIYLKALLQLGHVVYVSQACYRSRLPDICRMLEEANADIVWLTEKKPVAAMQELYGVFQQYTPGSAFLYARPDDVVSTGVFSRLEGVTNRFQINLTDHAYWLGTCAFDKCIEFRDYGAVASVTGRNIPIKKLVKLPFYPIADREKAFNGYPFPFDPATQKLVFSGGALYKTLGGGNLYYILAEHILQTYPETVFWYAGSGNRAQMDKLIAKYPGRVHLTAERNDLLQVLEHCCFYLSTYPVTGGLMFQYAACAKKLPITLKFDSEADGYLLNQSELGIEVQTLEEAKALIHRVLTDDAFRTEAEQRISHAVICADDFCMQLKKLLAEGKTDFPISLYDVDVTDLRREYLQNANFRNITSALEQQNLFAIARYLPAEFAAGMVKRIRNTLLGR